MNKIKPHTSDKSSLRKIAKERIASMSEEEKREASENICDELKTLLEKHKPGILVTYNPLPDEVNISEVWAWFQSISEVTVIGRDGSHTEIPTDKEIIILVPGRAFTKGGKRIGRGGGYYDKLLEKNQKAYTVGICFSCQIFDEIEQNPWDQKMSQVVFETNTLE